MLRARWLLLLISGDIERDPGSRMRAAQWNSGGLSQTKRLVLERKFREDMVLLRLLQDTRVASAGRHTIKIGGYQQVEQARAPHGGGASISVIEDPGEEVGVIEKKVPESDSGTEVLNQCESHDRIDALPQKDRRFQRVAGHLAGNKQGISGRSERELTPRGAASVTTGWRQGRVHRRQMRAERPADCQCRIGQQAEAGNGSTIVTRDHVSQRLRDLCTEVDTEPGQRSLLGHVRRVRGHQPERDCSLQKHPRTERVEQGEAERV
ncbi:hypothetical protein ERJ75_000643400 [Trypanosoma vivax]|nr:hypothetical protein ERJ75_000643400 [Trypanosoma vivax]